MQDTQVQHRSPAMAARLTDQLWSICDRRISGWRCDSSMNICIAPLRSGMRGASMRSQARMPSRHRQAVRRVPYTCSEASPGCAGKEGEAWARTEPRQTERSGGAIVPHAWTHNPPQLLSTHGHQPQQLFCLRCGTRYTISVPRPWSPSQRRC